MNRFRRFLKLAWVAQLAFVVLALPAAHVHRHGTDCCSSDHGSSGCSAHDHGPDCSHGHAVALAAKTDAVRTSGETTVQSPTDGSYVEHHCAACDLQRLIGQGFASVDTLLLEESPTLSALTLVSTCCGRDVEVRGCRGPPLAC